MSYSQFSIVLVDLNPVKGSEQSGVRPCLVISNSIANKYARTCIVAIISSVIKQYPHTLIIDPSIQNGLTTQSRIDFLQVRTVDYTRIVQKLGALETHHYSAAKSCLKIAFEL